MQKTQASPPSLPTPTNLSIGAMFSQHDGNIGVTLATSQEERSAAFLCPALDVGVARHEELSQLEEPLLCRQCDGALSDGHRRGKMEQERK